MRRKSLAGLATVVVFGLTGIGLAGPAWADDPEPPPPVGEVSAEPVDFEQVPQETQNLNEAEAMAKALVEERPVEVSSLTSETERVVADPSTGNLIAEVSPLPVRVEQPGGWVDLDSTLVEQPDGTVAPEAAVVDVEIDHGTKPFATVSDGDQSMSLTWPEVLPEPELHGEVAVWPNVAPGIDLAVETTAEGVRQFVVVRTPEAATDPLLSALHLGYDAGDLSVVAKNGGFEAKDAAGEVVFASAQLRMWESPVEMSGTPGEVAAAAIVAPEIPENRSASVGLTVTDDELLLAPDVAMLADPTTTFPVVIDPEVARKRVVWGMVWSDGQEFWDHATQDARVGYDGWEDNKKSRVFYRFDATTWKGKQVSEATLAMKQVHSPQWECDIIAPANQAVELWYTAGISSDLSWSNQPEWRRQIGSSRLAHGHRDACGDGDVFSRTEFTATAGAQIVSDEGFNTFTVGLRSNDETDKWGWRQFDNDGSFPVLTVTYNSTPNVPGLVALTPVVDYNGAKFMNMVTPTMKVAVSDPDGGVVRARFIINPVPDGDVDDRILYYTTTLTSGSTHSKVVPAGVLQNGKMYDFYARGNDMALESVSGPATRVTIDTAAPSKPTITVPTTNPAVGTAVSLKLTSTTSDTAEFVYGVNSDTPTATVEPTSLGGVATASFVVDKFGPNWVTVYAVDRAGNRSPTARAEFKVDGTLPYRQYFMDGNGNDTRTGTVQPTYSPVNLVAPTGTTPYIAEGRFHRYPDEPDGSPGGVRNSCDRSLTVSPTGTVKNVASTTDPANVSRQFSLSAWVKPASLHTVGVGTGFESMAVSAYRDDVSAFSLGYYKATATAAPTWIMMLDDDGVLGSRTWVTTTIPVQVNEWTHLTGVYSPASGTATFYVNGVLAKTVTGAAVFDADRLMVGGAPSGQTAPVGFNGQIDEVNVYTGVLDPVQVSNIHQHKRDAC